MIAKNIRLVEWYHDNGVTDVISNKARAYLKKGRISTSIYANRKSSRELADDSSNLEELRKSVQNFTGCDLKKTAKNTVFSDGNEKADVMLIGEAPGANEDERGIPFCGDSGQLLDNILNTINLNRKDNLYITNVIFWRPPANRKPTDEELKACLPFVEKHIALIKPKLLIIAGSVALYSLLGISDSISKYRQKILSYKNQYLDHEIPVIIIYHPSYLLRQPLQKKEAWHDMLFIKKFLYKL